MNRALVVSLLLGGVPARAAAQTPAPPTDTLRLTTVLDEALRADPRQRQLGLQARESGLRLKSIDAERYPAFAGVGDALYQSRVVTIPIKIPGVEPPLPPYATYDAHLEVTQSLLDPTRGPRRALERAQLVESQSSVRVNVYGIRGEVEEAFFTAAGDELRVASMKATIADLEARLTEARQRLHAGSALAGDTATIAATLYQRRQDLLQLRADEGAARARLVELVGHDFPASAVIELPHDGLAEAATAARTALEGDRNPHTRPEFAQFSATRARLSAQEAQIEAGKKPQLSAFTHFGVGRPGLNIFSRSPQGYYTAGVNVHWAPFDWNTDRRDREELELQREIVATNEESFSQTLRRSVQVDLATIQRLSSTLALDDSIVALREVVLREAAAQLREGVLTAANYLDRSTDLLSARLTNTDHRVTLAQARVHLLNTLGLELPSPR